MTYWITRTDTKKKNPYGGHAEIEITSVSFEDFSQASACERELEEERHAYMLRTHDPAELGVQYGFMTEDEIMEGQRRGIKIIDKRR